MEANKAYRIAVRRALAGRDSTNLQLHFEVAVLDHYRGSDGFSLIRTDTVGRLRKEGGWSLNFGITATEDLVHVSLGDLIELPEQERTHWSAFAVSLPASQTFLKMRLSPRSCFEDGKTRSWDW
jgi:hypothetical protein